MGRTYVDLLADRDLLRLQLQAYAACDDPEILAVVRDEWLQLHEAVARVSGGDERAVHAWLAEGMLLSVAASIGDLDAAVGEAGVEQTSRCPLPDNPVADGSLRDRGR